MCVSFEYTSNTDSNIRAKAIAFALGHTTMAEKQMLIRRRRKLCLSVCLERSLGERLSTTAAAGKKTLDRTEQRAHLFAWGALTCASGAHSTFVRINVAAGNNAEATTTCRRCHKCATTAGDSASDWIKLRRVPAAAQVRDARSKRRGETRERTAAAAASSTRPPKSG